jgi:CyaY protein
MDERRYQDLAAVAFRKLTDAFDAIDADDADLESSGDVIRITFRGGARVVINTQRPARQLWLAGGSSAWHFSYDDAAGKWLDDRSQQEFFEIIARLTQQAIGVVLQVA